MSEAADQIEAVVCNVKDMSGTLPMMKEVDVGDAGKCLLVRHEDGEFTALGHKCSHYGAPLARGALSNGIIRCPWHGACFNAKTGDIEDYPGLDSLSKYQVTVDKSNGEVKVHARRKDLEVQTRSSCLDSCVDPVGKDDKVVIIGGGPASVVCAETLRKEDFIGQITIICNEPHPPYDRAKLSKAPDTNPEAVCLRNPDHYEKIRVELRLNTEAVGINAEEKKVLVRRRGSPDGSDESPGAESEEIAYDHLFIATGGNPRTLSPIQGWDSENVLMLRTVDNGNKLASACKEKRVLLVGSSFISMEVAAYLAKKSGCSSIAVVCGQRSKVPFAASLGPEVGTFIMKMHEEKGVAFHTAVGVKELVVDQETNTVKQVKLTDDTTVDVDIVVLGIGVVPATDFLKTSGIQLNERGFVEVDSHMKTNLDNIYAGGDIVTFPLKMKGGETTNIQHWQMAHAHGNIAARSILNSYRTPKARSKADAVDSVPFFWTVQYGISIRYAGHGGKFDRVIIKGINKEGKILNAEEAMGVKKFVAFYVRNEDVVAVATMMSDPAAARFAQIVKNHGLFKATGIDKFLRGEKEKKDGCRLS